MREIKFRAFNKKENKMSKPFSMPFMLLNFTDDNGLGLMKDLTDEVVVQFTGLQDKNGVDIYDGDLVTDHVGVGCIQYMEKYAAFRVKYSDPIGRGKWFFDYSLKGERESIEVIGNIHQNKNLLDNI